MPLPSVKEAYEKAWKAIVVPMKIEYGMDDLGTTCSLYHIF